MIEQTLWVEKYRPRILDDCVIPDKLKKTLKGFVKKNEIPNIMFTGTQGTGKTTCAKALIRELNAEYIHINCSEASGKAMIEESVIPFASTISIQNPDTPKFILCDECDYLTPHAQATLRGVIEQFSLTTRFIFTANYPERIIPALKSRCTHFDMSIDKADKPELLMQFYKRCANILQENNVTFEQKPLGIFIAKHFPDFRKIINELQSYSSASGSIDAGILTLATDTIANSLFPLLKDKDFDGCRKWVSENLSSPEDVFTSLYNNLKDFVEPQQQPELILILAQYQDYATRVANQQINLMACFVEIMSSLKQ